MRTKNFQEIDLAKIYSTSPGEMYNSSKLLTQPLKCYFERSRVLRDCTLHIDGDPTNNNMSNLRYVTYSENSKNQSNTRKKLLSGPIEAINKSSGKTYYFESQKAATEALGVDQGNLSRHLAGKHYRSLGGWTFKRLRHD